MQATAKLLTLSLMMALIGSTSGVFAQPSEEQMALAQENFKGADADESGTLNRQEFETFIRANAEDKIGRADRIVRMGLFDRAFSRLDENGDGVIALDEFKKANAQN